MTDTYSCGIVMPRPTEDLFGLLGLSDEATAEEIRAVGMPEDAAARYAYKALNDPHYRALYRRHRNTEILYRAGFFDDGLPQLADEYTAFDKNFLTFTLEGLQTNRSSNCKAFFDNKVAVLVTTGGMSPIHNGHVEMMQVAKARLIERGYTVLGGFIAPGHDSYVGKKYNGTASISAAHRCAMVDLACRKIDWLQCDPWASRYMPAEINFTDVVRRLEQVFHHYCDTAVEIFYVFGSDNEGFELALPHNSIMVDRSELSSKAVREGDLSGLNPEVAEYYLNIGKEENDGLPYLIRDEGLLTMPEAWNNALGGEIVKRHHALTSTLRTGIIHAFKRAGMERKVITMPIKDQIEKAKVVVGERKTISLDPFYPADYYYHTSRRFQLSTPQYKAEGRMYRPGNESSYVQISSIPEGDYVLVEDDSVTGDTINYVKSYFEDHRRNINITDVVLLSDFAESNGTDYYDVVDMRDFIIGSVHGGLGVSCQSYNHIPCTKGGYGRAPYVLPFVSLLSRAKIPVEMEKELSLIIWQANLKFFKGSGIRIQDCHSAFIALSQFQNFSPETPMEIYCQFYLDILLEAA